MMRKAIPEGVNWSKTLPTSLEDTPEASAPETEEHPTPSVSTPRVRLPILHVRVGCATQSAPVAALRPPRLAEPQCRLPGPNPADI
jgi:hypothetical protein